jgi:cytochrome bd-type quinol oxidase subunit 1
LSQPAGPENDFFLWEVKKMSVALVFLFGVMFLAAVLAVRKRLQGGTIAHQVLVWMLFILLYLAAATGFSC